jgi:NAD(P)-dependent dehydrogenase (short-subunit alcohol dehydrogenase family)
MELELTDKRVLVTAASKGIGFAVARRFVDEGANVVLAARGKEGLDDAAAELAPTDRVTTCPVDLSSENDVATLLATIDADGPLDVAVLNTGGPSIALVLDQTLEGWDDAYRLLLRPVVQMGTHIGRSMAERGSGSIVVLTSTWVKQPKPGGVLSAAYRSAVSAFTKHLALELASSGVRVNQVMPGATATDRMRSIITATAERTGQSEDDELARILADIPLGRWADPAEVADAVVFLASPRSGATTGAALQIDGGAVRSTI